MKKIALLTALALGYLATGYAQQITEAARPMSLGTYNGLSLTLPNTSNQLVEKIWEKQLKEWDGKTKYDKKKKEFFTDNALIETMGNNTIDIYSSVTESGKDNIVYVWFDLGGAYLSSKAHPEKYPVATAQLEQFAKKVNKAQTELELEAANKVLKDKQSELKSLVNKKADLEQDIISLRERIKKAEEDIVTNESKITENVRTQETKKTEIDAQTKVVGEIQQKLETFK
jgi:hypothetical protein